MTTLKDLFPGRYLCAEDLGGMDTVFTIRSVGTERMQANPDADEESKPVIYFHEAEKGMILNKTNARAIAQLYGNVVEEWAGKRITLYPTRARAFKQEWDVIRVKPDRPAATPAPTNGHGKTGQASKHEMLKDEWEKTREDGREEGIEFPPLQAGLTDSQIELWIGKARKRIAEHRATREAEAAKQAALVPGYEDDSEPEPAMAEASPF